MAPPPPRRSPAAPASSAEADQEMRRMLLLAAFEGDIGSFNRLAWALDKGRGRLRDTVEGVRIEDGDEELRGLGALHVAASSGKVEMCRYLVEGVRVNVDAVDHVGRTPLFKAIHRQSVDTVKYLLDHGANPDKTDSDEFSALHCAAGLGCCEIVELLLEKGAYTDPVTGCGTPLHIAATGCNDRAMKILLDHNADYNKMVNGMTPLYFAINAPSVKCVKLLVEAGAVANGDYFLTALCDDPKSSSSECLMCVLGVGRDWHARNDSEPVDKRKIEELKSQGSKAVGRKDFLSAAEFYSMAMELDPDNATLFSNRSLCFPQLGKPLLSLLDALECGKRRPGWPKALYRQSKALMSLKDYRGACEAFLDALKLDTGNAEIEDGLRKALESLKVSQGPKVN